MWNIRFKNKAKISAADWNEYDRLFSDRVEEWLNNGYGSCVLGKKENAKVMSVALDYFDGERYVLDEWVVMPNHVHVLVMPEEAYSLDQILHSWKSYTVYEINKNENQTGQLWMHESFDYIVRSEHSLEYYRKYIRENPVKAGITAPASSWNMQPSLHPDVTAYLLVLRTRQVVLPRTKRPVL